MNSSPGSPQEFDRAEDAAMTTPEPTAALHDPVAVLCDRLWGAMDALGRYGDFDANRDQDRWDRLHNLLLHLRGSGDKPATDEAALIIARALLRVDELEIIGPLHEVVVLKPSRDVDLYVEWSSVVESATFIGDRTATLTYLAEDDARQHPGYSPDAGNTPEDRLRRADECGTSALYGNPRDGSWEDAGFIVEQRGWLRRADLLAFAEAIGRDDEAAAYGLLQPFEDDTEAGERA